MKISKFIKVDNDVLLEYIYDDENIIIEDYCVIYDTVSNTQSFATQNTTNSQASITKNIINNQLFLLDNSINKWGLISYDANRYNFIQFKTYSNNIPFRYDKIRLHFPVNYTFKDNLGILLNVLLFNKKQNKYYPLSNYFYDKTNPLRTDIELTAPPFIFNEKMWGKYIELNIPSPYTVINDTTIIDGVAIPRTGTVHKNLLNNDILSSETPIFINFQFLKSKNNIANQISYYTTEKFSVTIPYSPEFETVGVKITKSDFGDYFEINGVFNNSISEFNSFINKSQLLNKRFYVIYDIKVYEKNINTYNITLTQFENFDIPLEYRPIIKYSTTTAIIDVTMRLINTVDDSTVTRNTSYVMKQDEIAKYSRNLTKINMSNAYKPKVYNAKSDILNINFNNSSNIGSVSKVYYANMYERVNISVKSVSEQVNDTTYYGQGQNQILLYPSDNIFKFAIITNIKDNQVIPYPLPTESNIYLRFKSSDTLIESGLFYDSNEINLSAGIVVFNVIESNYEILKKMFKNGFDQYYIVLKSENNINTTIYSGRFLPIS